MYVWNRVHVEFWQFINTYTISRIIFTVVRQTFVKCRDKIDEENYKLWKN